MSNEENHTESELKVQISLFIPKSLKKRIAQYCIDHDTTQTVIVTEAIKDWFEKKSPAPCAARTQPVSQNMEPRSPEPLVHGLQDRADDREIGTPL